ncbi:MAG: hypothetical protein KC680_03085 [Candidatus Peregrinibacteria bacterium]|nr:hypothetical protein [Candidatus Peregrinibacteria bacterium]
MIDEEGHAEEGAPNDDPGLQRRINAALRTAGLLRDASSETSHQVQSTLAFKADQYELLRRCGDVVELGLEDLPEIGRFYASKELSEDAFTTLSLGDVDGFRYHLKHGCYVNRWETTDPEELELLEQFSGGNYVQSGEEFAEFLDGVTIPSTRGSDFRTWGFKHPETGKLLAIAAAFVPPQNSPERMIKHCKHIENFFRGEGFHASTLTDVDGLCDRADKTAEFYLIGAEPGFGLPVFSGMLNKLDGEGYFDSNKITDWYLLRFAGMKQVHPCIDKRVSRDDDNPASEKLFKGKLGFGNCGEHRNGRDFAARRSRNSGVVVVDVSWKVMHGEQEHIMSDTNAEMAKLHARGAAALQKKAY